MPSVSEGRRSDNIDAELLRNGVQIIGGRSGGLCEFVDLCNITNRIGWSYASIDSCDMPRGFRGLRDSTTTTIVYSRQNGMMFASGVEYMRLKWFDASGCLTGRQANELEDRTVRAFIERIREELIMQRAQGIENNYPPEACEEESEEEQYPWDGDDEEDDDEEDDDEEDDEDDEDEEDE